MSERNWKRAGNTQSASGSAKRSGPCSQHLVCRLILNGTCTTRTTNSTSAIGLAIASVQKEARVQEQGTLFTTTWRQAGEGWGDVDGAEEVPVINLTGSPSDKPLKDDQGLGHKVRGKAQHGTRVRVQNQRQKPGTSFLHKRLGAQTC